MRSRFQGAEEDAKKRGHTLRSHRSPSTAEKADRGRPPPPSERVPATLKRNTLESCEQHACVSPRPPGVFPPPSLLPTVRIVKDGLEDAPASNLYVTSVYWTVTTLSTVGYGDIFASTIAERTYCILVSDPLVAVLVGVCSGRACRRMC